MQISKRDVTPEVWDSLCEIALGYPIDNSHELLDVVSFDAKTLVPCEPKTRIYDNGETGTFWMETTKENFRKTFE